MATFYMNHEVELYHSGRKGMKWGKHLPDILDPTRQLVGKAAKGFSKTGKSVKGFTNKIGLTGKKWDPNNQFNKKYYNKQASKMREFTDRIDQQTQVEKAFQMYELGRRAYNDASKEFNRQQEIIDKALKQMKSKPADAPRLVAIAAKAFANQKIYKKKMDDLYDEFFNRLNDEVVRYESSNIDRHFDNWNTSSENRADFYKNEWTDENYNRYKKSPYKVRD